MYTDLQRSPLCFATNILVQGAFTVGTLLQGVASGLDAPNALVQIRLGIYALLNVLTYKSELLMTVADTSASSANTV